MDEETRKQRRLTIRGFTAAGFVVLIWSGFNIVSRIGGKSALTPFDMLALRLGVSGLLLLPVFLRRPRAMPWWQIFVIAGVGGVTYGLVIYSGFAFAPAAHAGILVNGGIPFTTAIIAWGLLGFRPNTQGVLAFSLTALGIALIGGQSAMQVVVAGERWWLGDVFFMIAAMCWGLYGVLLRKWQLTAVDAITALTIGSAIMYLPVYLLFLPKAITLVAPQQLLLQGVYQGVVVALGAGLCYAYATQTIGPIKASLTLALVPGITAVLAVPLLGESLGIATACGLLLVTLGAIWGSMASASAQSRRIFNDAAGRS